MDRNDADMIARAICDEQDQRDRDSKIFPSQSDLLRKFRTDLRNSNRSYSNNSNKVSKEIQNKSDMIYCIGYILAILFMITFCMNMKFLMLLCSIAIISLFAIMRHREVKLCKKNKWNKKEPDTMIYDMLIVMVIFATVIAEAILFFLFG